MNKKGRGALLAMGGCLALALLFFGGLFALRSEVVNRTLFPDRYWSKKVATLERTRDFLESNLQNARLEIVKKQLTWQLDLAGKVIAYRAAGLSGEEAAKWAGEEMVAEIEVLGKIIKGFAEALQLTKKELNEARKELSRVRGG